ncbi:MAG: hypothetical protein FJ278_09845 [Planctomycetes bacterium]|nr:hypothetical protein [Planctomycetota bacterium]
MVDDPIVAEVRRVRERHARRFNYDPRAIFEDLKQKEKASGRKVVSYPPKRLAHAADSRPRGN